MEDTLRSPIILTKLQKIAEQALNYPEMVFTTLLHHIDLVWLEEAFFQTRQGGASGVDKITTEVYVRELDKNLKDLLNRLKSGKYRATPVKRVWIEKEGGKKRPLGIPVLEDKIVQRAVLMLLEPIYEKMFYKFSYGFRKCHSQHQALQELREQCLKGNIRWILDADVSGFFDNIGHGKLREFIKKRVNDGGIMRLIGKWLNAGVLESGNLSHPDKGTQQGGVISPFLGNIYLHYVLDEWFEGTVKPRMKGKCFIIRYADDFLIGFELDSDAKRVMEILPKRFEKYKLAINTDKTALVDFTKPSEKIETDGKSGTFNFLGFTHYWGKSLRGYWVIKRKTMSKRLKRAIKIFWEWIKANRHAPLKEQYNALCQKLSGYYQYYGIVGNYKAIDTVYHSVMCSWKYWLSRCGSRFTWDKLKDIVGNFLLPKPRIIHNI
jgi:RNA-directed DNA polymerase